MAMMISEQYLFVETDSPIDVASILFEYGWSVRSHEDPDHVFLAARLQFPEGEARPAAGWVAMAISQRMPEFPPPELLFNYTTRFLTERIKYRALGGAGLDPSVTFGQIRRRDTGQLVLGRTHVTADDPDGWWDTVYALGVLDISMLEFVPDPELPDT